MKVKDIIIGEEYLVTSVLVVIILFLAFTAPSVSEIGTALVCTQSNGEVVCVEN